MHAILNLALAVPVALLKLHLHHHFHGSPIDYGGLAAASAASFFGLPGPGEPLLIAAGILAAKHKLDITEVILIAWAGATAGGVAGWLLGRAGGRRLLTAHGPLRRLRLAALARGDAMFERYPVFAVLVTPSVMAGIHRMGARRYLTINAASALAWAAGIGLGAFYAGPAVLEWVEDLGWVVAAGFVLLVAGGILAGRAHRTRRRARGAGAPRGEGASAPEAPPQSPV